MKIIRIGRILICAGVLGFLACPRASNTVDAGKTESDAGSPDAAESQDVDAGGVMPATTALPISFSVRTDAGELVSLPLTDVDAGLELDSTRGLQVDFAVQLPDFRVRIFDDHDAVVESDDSLALVEDAGASYRLELKQALKPGHRYLLMVDPEVGSVLVDDHGHSWDEFKTWLRVRGSQVDEASSAGGDRGPGRPKTRPKRRK